MAVKEWRNGGKNISIRSGRRRRVGERGIGEERKDCWEWEGERDIGIRER